MSSCCSGRGPLVAFSFNWCQSLKNPRSVISGECPSEPLLECFRDCGHIV